jgi:hypothetical protein
MIKLTQQMIVDLFIEMLRVLPGTKAKKTVVNRADPTEIEVIEAELGLVSGFDETDLEPEIVKVKIVATPYGTDINFLGGHGPDRLWNSGYLDDDNKWHRVTGEDFFRKLQQLISCGLPAATVKSMLEQCERCGSTKQFGQSCGCFDNHCE